MGLTKNQKYWLIGIGIGSVALVTLIIIYFSKRGKGGGSYKMKYFSEEDEWYKYKGNKEVVENLHPDAVPRFKDFLSKVEKELGYVAIATSGYRSWEEQKKLKAQDSRNASAGNSSHNYGFALDVNFMKDGVNVLKKATDTSKWQKSGILDLAKDMGFLWGGTFEGYPDRVHFYYEPISRNEMKERYLAGQKDSKGYVNLG